MKFSQDHNFPLFWNPIINNSFFWGQHKMFSNLKLHQIYMHLVQVLCVFICFLVFVVLVLVLVSTFVLKWRWIRSLVTFHDERIKIVRIFNKNIVQTQGSRFFAGEESWGGWTVKGKCAPRGRLVPLRDQKRKSLWASFFKWAPVFMSCQCGKKRESWVSLIHSSSSFKIQTTS